MSSVDRTVTNLPVDAIDAIAQVAGRGTGRVVVERAGDSFRVVAGPADRPDEQIVLTGLDAAAVRGFVDDVRRHLTTRTGARPSVPFDEPFPASARLSDGRAVLNVYDDGSDFSVMAVGDGRKAGTGAFASLTGVQDFARDLDRHLTGDASSAVTGPAR